ncbi:kinase-like domain-containing protein [Glomus cerebriforme]|uniref:non-specific serine/threonine protein kinase n=1 Tax=Glomus cerebriforme TaxID=658196 RepID=A0A397TMU0_9GLOM|nr:kinase-like domain-containing protein [Glomus cerebriforme]
MRSRKNKNLRQTAQISGDDVDFDNITTILPNVRSDIVEPDSFFLYEPPTGRVMRSRRNTFTYGQAGEGSSSQSDIDKHYELVPYSKEWTVILRNENAGQLVLYNTANRRVSVRRLSPSNDPLSSQPQALTTSQTCILCKRPFESTNRMSGPSNPDFMHRNYFRLLENSESSSIQPDASPIIDQPTFSMHNVSSHTFAESSTSSTNPDFETHSTLSQNSFNQGYYERFFIEERKLGRGFRGSVYLCKHILDNVHLGEYAIKKVAVGDNHSWLVRMLREVHLLERLHHPNIVDYKHAWLEYHQLTKFGPQVPCLFILMECANGGNLEEYINERSSIAMQQDPEEANLRAKERVLRARRMRHAHEQSTINPLNNVSSNHYLDLPEIWSLFIDICEGLAHLHRHGIVHRDLKPSNLLLHYNEGRTDRPRVLISDFGECEILDQLTERERTGATGTLEFMAPELLTVDERGKFYKDYSQKSDMWSLGMVLYYLCYSRLPYHQVDDVDLLKQEILHFEGVSFPENNNFFSSSSRKVPQQLKSLIKRLLSKNKKNRPSCDEILKSVEDIRLTFSTNVYNETPDNTIISLPNQKDVVDSLSELESPVSSSNSTTTTRITANNETANLRRRKKVHISQENSEGSSTSGIEDADIEQMSKNHNNQAAIIRATPPRSSLYQITYYLGLISSQIFEGGWWQLSKFIIVILKITTCVSLCSPYLPSPWVLYPIIFFAILDLYTKRGTFSLVLGVIHIIWIIVFKIGGNLCKKESGMSLDRLTG